MPPPFHCPLNELHQGHAASYHLMELTMTSPEDFGFGTQIRKSPFFDATVKWGAAGFSVYNHMFIPAHFGDPDAAYDSLINGVVM